MLITELIELGLTEEEAKVYLATLELGGSYVSLIAKKAGVNRVGCYHTLAKLEKKGIITCFSHNNIKYFTVESPRLLVNKQQEMLNKAKLLLPELLTLTSSSSYKPKIHYFEGIDGIKHILEDAINQKDEIIGYTNLENLPKIIPHKYLQDYARRKISQKIKTRMLSPLSDSGRKYLKTFYPPDFDRNLVEIMFVNPKEFFFEYEINIYENKVAILSLSAEEPIGLIIESPIYAKTQKGIFNLAWLGATSFIAK